MRAAQPIVDDGHTRPSLVVRIRRAFDFDFWRTDLSGASRAHRTAITVIRIGMLVADGFQRHHLTTRAAALTFTTLFGLVPTLAVAFAMFKAFGGLESAKEVLLPRIIDYLAVGVREDVAIRIDEMLGTIHGGAIGAVGSLFMLGAVISLLSSIEDTFNEIWGVTRLRNYLYRVPVYFTVVMLTPVTLIGALSLPAVLRRLAPVEWAITHTGPAQLVFAKLLPLLLIWFSFAMMYAFMTSARVRVRAALLGGVVSGTVWSIAAWGYTGYAGQSAFYSTVYGPLAAIPIFLFWLYVSWVIVLVGAQVAYASESVASYRDAMLAADAPPAQRLLLALGIVAHISARYTRAEAPPTRTVVGTLLGTSARLVNEIVDELIDRGFLYESEDTGFLVPARDPRTVTVAEFLRSLQGTPSATGPGGTCLGSLVERLGEVQAAEDAAWAGATCADLGDFLRAESSDGVSETDSRRED